MKMHFCSDFICKECPEAVCYIRIAESFQNKFLKDKEFEHSFVGLMSTSLKIVHNQAIFSIFKLVLVKTVDVSFTKMFSVNVYEDGLYI